MSTAAPACKAALDEATRRWPRRSRTSDGILPSLAHSVKNPTSDHERGNAFDLTHDPEHGVDCNVLAQHVTADPRVKYVIWDRKIWNPAISLEWRPYTGSNPHTKHMHVSIRAGSRFNMSPWWERRITTLEEAMANHPELADIEGPLSFHLLQDSNGICTGYAIFGTTTGELHGYGPGWKYYGRSEDPTPDD